MRWLLIANVGGLIGVGLFWPSAGRHLSTMTDAHVQWVIATAALSVVILLLAATGRRISDRAREWWIVLGSLEVLQIARYWMAIRAMDHWPGGDDGPGLGWLMFLVPYMLILVLIGGFVIVRHLTRGGWFGPLSIMVGLFFIVWGAELHGFMGVRGFNRHPDDLAMGVAFFVVGGIALVAGLARLGVEEKA